MIATFIIMIRFITVVAWFSIVAKAGDIYCNASYECVGEFVNNNGDGHVYALGYKANYGSTSSIYGTGTAQSVLIRGAFGAYQIGTLYNPDSAVWS